MPLLYCECKGCKLQRRNAEAEEKALREYEE